MRAARGLLGWSQRTLAAKAGVSVPTVKRLEAGVDGVNDASLAAVAAAIEHAGVSFVAPGSTVVEADHMGVQVGRGVALVRPP